MVSAEQCRLYATECERLLMERGITYRRAAILMNLRTSWKRLANQMARYDEVVEDETPITGSFASDAR
jgi:hypothetical protein